MTDMTYLQTLQREIEERYPKAFEDYLNLKAPIRAVADLSKNLASKTVELDALKARMAEIENALKNGNILVSTDKAKEIDAWKAEVDEYFKEKEQAFKKKLEKET